jgi:hypothetical protein
VLKNWDERIEGTLLNHRLATFLQTSTNPQLYFSTESVQLISGKIIKMFTAMIQATEHLYIVKDEQILVVHQPKIATWRQAGEE